MSRKQRFGFTLVELLVVIAIIGMLVSLLLPAVNAAREAGRRSVCQNNIRQLALALINYESQRGALPGIYEYRQQLGTTNWWWRPALYEIMPQLERSDIYEAYSRETLAANGDSIPAFYLPLMVCPSDPQIGTDGTAYCYNFGYNDFGGSTSSNRNRANGLFDKVDSYRVSSNTLSNVKDGQSNTLMLAENIDASSWRDNDPRRVGFGWLDVAQSQWINYGVNRLKGTSGGNPPSNPGLSWQFARPSSNHPTVANFAFADGHVRTIGEQVSYPVYAQLCTSDGARATNGQTGGALSNFTLQVLDDKEY